MRAMLHLAWDRRADDLERLEDEERMLSAMLCVMQEQCLLIQDRITEVQQRQDRIRRAG